VTVETHEGSTYFDFAGRILLTCTACGKTFDISVSGGPRVVDTRRLYCCGGSEFGVATDVRFGEWNLDKIVHTTCCARCGIPQKLATIRG
jgi:hypothetical protein